jgi:hypothetical protein
MDFAIPNSNDRCRTTNMLLGLMQQLYVNIQSANNNNIGVTCIEELYPAHSRYAIIIDSSDFDFLLNVIPLHLPRPADGSMISSPFTLVSHSWKTDVMLYFVTVSPVG